MENDKKPDVKVKRHKIYWPFRSPTRWARLSGSLKAYSLEVERRMSLPENHGKEWVVNLRKALEQCQNQLDNNRIDEGWKSFDTARRLEIVGMEKLELQQVAKVLRQEATKLSEWRMKAIFSIIGDPEHPVSDEMTAEMLYEATLVRDEDFNNTYYKNRLIRNLFTLLFSMLILWSGLIILYFFTAYDCINGKTFVNCSQGVFLLGILLFGLLGATTSSILITRQRSGQTRITEISSNAYVTLSRIVVGAAFSIFIFMILKSEMAARIDLFTFKINSPLDFFAIAFVSGFAERLAKNAIEALAGKEK
jgi:hypothetical protein